MNINMTTNKNASKIQKSVLCQTFLSLELIETVLVTFVDIVFVTFFDALSVTLTVSSHNG